MSELRKDHIWGEWVIISPERASRPDEFKQQQVCPFCPGNEHLTPPARLVIEEEGEWKVRVVPNRYPAVGGEGKEERGYFFASEPAEGAHEVVVETRVHSSDIDTYPPHQLELVFRAWAERIKELKRSYPYVILFRNHGAGAGASRPHPHSQIIALKYIPPRVERMLGNLRRRQAESGSCPFCSFLEGERESERFIAEGQYFMAFAPFAPRFSFEVWIVAKQHLPLLEETPSEKARDFLILFQKVISAIKKVLHDPPYNIAFHNLPAGWEGDSFHWHCQIYPRLSALAGFELGSGVFINPSEPEKVASLLREAL